MTTETHSGEADANYWRNQHAVLLAAFERRTGLLRETLRYLDSRHFPKMIAKIEAELSEQCTP